MPAFKSLTEFCDHFHNEAVCAEHLASIRFRNGEYCPHCRHNEIYKFNDGKRYRCAKCKTDFTIRNGTVFGDSKLSLRKWFVALYLLSTSGKGISSYQLAKQINVTQKTAWFMVHRIRSSMKQNKGQLLGTIEADETYIGGKAKNMHAKRRRQVITGTGGINKIPVFGVKQRDGEVRATVVKETGSTTLHALVKENVAPQSTLYTDEWRAYNGLGRQFNRAIVRHSLREYVVGDCHTNGIESFWSIVKRTYNGIYHYMSRKHLQRYIDEICFRFNRRCRQMHEVFQDVVAGMIASPPLPIKQLVQNQL